MSTYLQTAIENALEASAGAVVLAAPTAVETPIRGATGTVTERESAPVYAAPDERSAVIAQLARGTVATLTSSAGPFFAVLVDGRRGYVRRADIAAAIDTIPAAEQEPWDRRMAAAAQRIDAAGHRRAAPLRGAGQAPVDAGIGVARSFMDLQHKLSMTAEWADEEEAAQRLLRDYALWYMARWHGGTLPASLRMLFDYVGRSAINAAKAAPRYKSVADFGGGLDAAGRPLPNWCTAATTGGVLRGLRALGLAPTDTRKFLDPDAKKTLHGRPLKLFGPSAYTAPLLPGDMVMYLFDGCQYGGHTVTAVEDLGDAFTHVSGNAGDAIGVAIGEARRLRTPPGGAAFKLANALKSSSREERDASTRYIAGLSFGPNAKLVYSIVRFGAIFAELAKLPTLAPQARARLLADLGLRELPPAAARQAATSIYLQTAIEDALGLARAASGGSGRPAAPPAPSPTPPPPAAPAPSPEARAAADAIRVRDHIKGEAKARATRARSVPTASNFYRRLVGFYLKPYLAAPTPAAGKTAAESRIGKAFAGPATAGDAWEDGALRFWNRQPIPPFARRMRPLLPAELAAATDILSRKNRKLMPYIDVPQLVGTANMGTGFDADVAGGGKNISQLMHWATGVKYSDIDKLTMRELFLAYELWHLEAWDVFGEDPINDLIAEEAGRILGSRLRTGSVTTANLRATLDEGFAEARAWVGTLLRARSAELDDWIVARTQKPANIWYGAQPPMDIWGSETIFSKLRAGASVDDVKRSALVERIVDIYTLLFEADAWEQAHGAIDNGTFIPVMLSGRMDAIFERLAKGKPVVSFQVMRDPSVTMGAAHAGALGPSIAAPAPGMTVPTPPAPRTPPAPPAPPPPPTRVSAGALRNAADIDALFHARAGRSFIDWFNATQANRGAWANRSMRTDADTRRRWTQVWDGIPQMFGTTTITLEQFVALQSILINELGGRMAPITERMGRPGHPGMAYLFDRIEGVKSSYNRAPNMTALQCFNDADFNAAHGALAPGARLATTTNQAWGGQQWPAGEPTDMATAPYIAQADFCKFRGRGLIQTTWRGAYASLVRWIQAYSGSSAKVNEYRTRWAGQDVQRVLTRSGNADWDDLFQQSGYAVPWAGVRLHNQGAGNYLAISADPAIRAGTGPGSFYNMGRRISGSASYGDLFRRRCQQILDGLAAAVPPAAPDAQALEGGPPPSSELEWDGATADQLAFKRRVYDTQVRRSARGGRFVPSVPASELGDIEGGHKARTAAADACRRLLADARAALAAAQAAGDAPARAVQRIGVVSAYRSVRAQFNAWNAGFARYYQRTAARRQAAPGGEHGEQATELTARYIGGILASPGYSLHNDGRAVDLRTVEGGHTLGASTDQRDAWRRSWLFGWLTGNAARYGFFQNLSIDEPWHWEFRAAAAAPGAQGLSAVALGAVASGQADVQTVALLAEHHDAGPDMVLRWNDIADLSAGIDVVVHLHGFSGDRHLDLRTRKLPLSGLDFVAPVLPANVHAPAQPAWTGRRRPTLLVLPRGRARPGHPAAYDFPALVRPNGFAQLVDVALREFETRVGAGRRVEPRRMVLTAHSGGGAPLNRILARTADTPLDPHEVHVFDALYGDPSGVRGWATRRLRRDVERLQRGVPDPAAFMATEGGALRILYLHGSERATTRPGSLAVQATVHALIPRGTALTDLLDRRYRTEVARVSHSLVPYWYGGRLLADAAADVPGP